MLFTLNTRRLRITLALGITCLNVAYVVTLTIGLALLASDSRGAPGFTLRGVRTFRDQSVSIATKQHLLTAYLTIKMQQWPQKTFEFRGVHVPEIVESE